MGVIFVNYRAKDNPLGAAGIHDMLARRFGGNRVFRDSVSMAAGEHYPTTLREPVEQADVLVAVIGPRWNELADEQGRLLIQRDRDWVRWEIARAIERGIPIVPVVLRGTPEDATPPDPAILPASIRTLAEYQTFEVHQKQFGTDLDRLANRLVALVPTLARPEPEEERGQARTATVDAARLVQTWAPAISRAATGHLIGERLVLTAWHATGDQTHPDSDGLAVRVFDPRGHTRWMRARRIWPAEAPDIDTRPDLDVALVQIDDPDWAPHPGLEPVRFGRITDTRAITCRAVGFPRAGARPDELRETTAIAGHSQPQTAPGHGLIVFSVTARTPRARDDWAGGSGAALHCGDLITGVLIEDHRTDYPGTQLRAADLAHLAEHTDLPQALHAAGITLTFHDATAPTEPPGAESTTVLDGPPPRSAFRRKALYAIIMVVLVGALILGLSLPGLLHNNNAANSTTASGHPGTNSPPNGATTAGQRDSTSTTEVTSPTVTKTPVRPGHLPDPCQAAAAPTVSEFDLGAGKPMPDTPAPTKSCGWATTNNVNERSYRLIAIYYVTGKGALPSGFTPAPVSLPGVEAFQHSDGLSCQLAWTTSFGAIVVMVGHNIYAPASTAPDMCTVAATWSTAIFPNLPG